MRRDGENKSQISEKQKRNIFRVGTGQANQLEAPREFRFCAHANFGRLEGVFALRSWRKDRTDSPTGKSALQGFRCGHRSLSRTKATAVMAKNPHNSVAACAWSDQRRSSRARTKQYNPTAKIKTTSAPGHTYSGLMPTVCAMVLVNDPGACTGRTETETSALKASVTMATYSPR
jgi:hypothetical protein